jgi:hypothetical protein
MSSYETLIAKAILGDDKDKETSARQITCKAAASHMMVCQCGHILDQKTVHVLEVIDVATNEEKTLAACCPDCAKSHAVKLETIARVQRETNRYRWQTWRRTIDIEGRES